MRIAVIFFILFASPTFASVISIEELAASRANTFYPKCASMLIQSRVTIATAADVQAISQIECLVGVVELKMPGAFVVLPKLRMVYGGISIASSGVKGFSAPSLEEINGKLLIQWNTDLERLELPRLGSLNGYHLIHGNPGLAHLAFRALGAVNGRLLISENISMEKLDLNALGGVNGVLKIRSNARLSEIRLGNLKAVNGMLQVAGNPSLQSAGLQGLAKRLKEANKFARIEIQ